MADLNPYLQRVVKDGASDLFIAVGAPISEKTGTEVEPITKGRLAPDTAMALIKAIYEKAGRPMDRLETHGDDDFSFAVPGLARFRVNTYKQRGTFAAVLRIVAFEIPDYKAIGIPGQIMSLASVQSGMIIVTGAAGSGKSTTNACIIDHINHNYKRHVVTLEDPIEYLHRNDKAIVSQREIALDTDTYLSALRACLRQAPDVIYLGEMRDPETIRTAMTAAETGHLVLATLHTKGAANAIDRIIDSFPPGQQAQIRAQLAMVLHTVVSQQLVQDVRGKPVAAFEILRMTTGMRGLVRDAKTHQIDNAILTGAKDGMVPMDKSLADLYAAGRITAEIAVRHASNPDAMRKTISG